MWRNFCNTHPYRLAGYNYRTVEIDEIDECAAFTIPEEKVVILREDVYAKLHANHVFGRSTVVHELSHLALAHRKRLAMAH